MSAGLVKNYGSIESTVSLSIPLKQSAWIFYFLQICSKKLVSLKKDLCVTTL